MAQSKHALRESMGQTLGSIDATVRATASAAICAELEAIVPKSGTVLVFLPDKREPNIDPFIQTRLAAGGLVAAPRCDWDAGTFTPVPLVSLEAVEVRRHGVREPIPADVVNELAAVLVPGIAFDPTGGRLGRGGGFYDRFLASLPEDVQRIGVCFATQRVDRVPRESHDAGVGEVVTENGRVFSDRSSA